MMGAGGMCVAKRALLELQIASDAAQIGVLEPTAPGMSVAKHAFEEVRRPRDLQLGFRYGRVA